MNRRRFLLLGAGATTGIWVAGAGLLQLPGSMVLKLGGICSFCGKRAGGIRAFAGVGGRPVRVCDECVELCLDILAEEPDWEAANAWRSAPPPRREATRTEAKAFADSLGIETGSDPFESLWTEFERQIGVPPGASATPAPRSELACSFCDRLQKETRKMIAGPSVYICEACIGDAATVLQLYRA